MSNAVHIERIISGMQPMGVFRPEFGWSDDPLTEALMLAGSFRPLHRGHRALLNAAWEITSRTTTRCFEISISNVEKPDIAVSDLEQRLSQFRLETDIVVITRAATFIEKARLMPGTKFAIGFDTAVRLFDDRFYAPSNRDLLSPTIVAMTELRALGSMFIVGGRHDGVGEFKTLSDLNIPAGFESLLIEIPEKDFSDPISSTQLRSSHGDT